MQLKVNAQHEQNPLENRNKHTTGLLRRYKATTSLPGLPSRLPAATGTVVSFSDGVLTLSGLRSVGIGEVVLLGDNYDYAGVVYSLSTDLVGLTIVSRLRAHSSIKVGGSVKATGRALASRFSYYSAGRVLGPLGQPLDGKEPPRPAGFVPVESPALGVLERRPVTEPLVTGLLAFDSLIPLGHGQREALMGDSRSGKTTAALTILQTQTRIDPETRLFYVSVGQSVSQLALLLSSLRERACLESTTVIATCASDPTALQVVTPPAACAVAERHARKGARALVIYDSLTKHAEAYRELSTLLRCSPGREGYPTDLFFKHSKLLERAGAFKLQVDGQYKRSGSVTAVPVLDLDNGDLSGYLPTNIVSITDGQAILSMELFTTGFRPALDSGISVSRLGTSVQPRALRAISSSAKAWLTELKETARIAELTSDLDATTTLKLARGSAVAESLKQDRAETIEPSAALKLLYASVFGFLDVIPEPETNLKPLLQLIKDPTYLKASSRLIKRCLQEKRALNPSEISVLALDLMVLINSKGYPVSSNLPSTLLKFSAGQTKLGGLF
jgi:F-type H+-transporting ATPase subunit alpha